MHDSGTPNRFLEVDLREGWTMYLIKYITLHGHSHVSATQNSQAVIVY